MCFKFGETPDSVSRFVERSHQIRRITTNATPIPERLDADSLLGRGSFRGSGAKV